MSVPKHTQAFLNQRKLLVFLPVPGVLCLTALFYLGGGGQGISNTEAGAAAGSGINTSLPAAGKTSLYANKLEAYQAPPDSTHRNNLAFVPDVGERSITADTTTLGAAPASTAGLNYAVQPGQSRQAYDPAQDPNVRAVQSRLQQMQQQTEAPPGAASNANPGRGYPLTSSRQDDQLEQSVQELEELRQQYEQRLQAFNPPTAVPTPAAEAAPVATPPKVSKALTVVAEPVSVVNRLQSASVAATSGNRFHGLGGVSRSSAPGNAVPAVVHSDQAVVPGQTVKLRLLADVQFADRVIPANTLVYGVCGLSTQRLTITVHAIHYENSIVPVNLAAYDLDGGEGLNIPGSVERDAAQQSLAAGASSADLLTLSPSLGAQAAGIALQTGKALAGKKIKQVTITLKANYKLLLQ